MQNNITRLDKRVISRFWLVMSAKYGHKWTSNFTDEISLDLARDEWAKELSKFTMEQIRQALDVVIDYHPSWPPTIGEFKQLCKMFNKQSEFEPPQIEDKTGRPVAWAERQKHAKPFLNRLHKIIKGSKK